MDRPVGTQVETQSGTVTARPAELSEVRRTGKATTQENPRPKGPLWSSKKGLTAVVSRNRRSLSGTSQRPRARPGPSTDIGGASHVPGQPGRPPSLSSELPKFTLYIQEGSVFLKVVGAGEGGGGRHSVSVSKPSPLLFLFPLGCPEPGRVRRPVSWAG